MATIDRADWHYGGTYPPDLPPENAGTHIGIYLAWIIHRGLGSPTLQQFAGDLHQQVLDREITGRHLLYSALDEKLIGRLLSQEGRAFTAYYYESNLYLSDYDGTLGGELETLYHVADTWHNFDSIAPVLDERLQAWRRAGRTV